MDQILLGRDVWIRIVGDDDQFHRAEIVVVNDDGFYVIFSEGHKKGLLKYYYFVDAVDSSFFSFCKVYDKVNGVVLKSIPFGKIISIIKIIRMYTNYGLKEAKDLLDSVNNPDGRIIDSRIDLNTGLKEKLNKETAQKLYNELKENGCEVELESG